MCLLYKVISYNYTRTVLHVLIHGGGAQKGVRELLQLHFRSRSPIYEQLVEKIKELIVHKVMKDDEQLPSVRELAQELTVNPNTIQKAYRELERLGYIYSVQGKGSFVMPRVKMENSRQKDELLEQLKKIVAELLHLGAATEDIRAIVEQTGKGGAGA